MTDLELLKLAANAAGIPSDWIPKYSHLRSQWNPLTDDGDALRLAAKLKIDLEWQNVGELPEPTVEAYKRGDENFYDCFSEHEDDYKRAIVRAAAEIGRSMP